MVLLTTPKQRQYIIDKIAVSKNVELSGYTPIGIMSYTITGTKNDFCSMYGIDIKNQTTTYFYGGNRYSSAQNISVVFAVLYIKNNILIKIIYCATNRF